jgi:hypothetical protein
MENAVGCCSTKANETHNSTDQDHMSGYATNPNLRESLRTERENLTVQILNLVKPSMTRSPIPSSAMLDGSGVGVTVVELGNTR